MWGGGGGGGGWGLLTSCAADFDLLNNRRVLRVLEILKKDMLEIRSDWCRASHIICYVHLLGIYHLDYWRG